MALVAVVALAAAAVKEAVKEVQAAVAARARGAAGPPPPFGIAPSADARAILRAAFGAARAMPTGGRMEVAQLPAAHSRQARSGGGQTFAERQLQREKDEQKLLQQKKKLQEETKRLREENKKMEAELEAARAATRNGADDGDSDCEMEASEGDYSTWSEDDRQRRLELARSGLAYATEAHGESPAEANRIRVEIEGLQRASREAKPFRAHRAQLERRRDRLRRQQERD